MVTKIRLYNQIKNQMAIYIWYNRFIYKSSSGNTSSALPIKNISKISYMNFYVYLILMQLARFNSFPNPNRVIRCKLPYTSNFESACANSVQMYEKFRNAPVCHVENFVSKFEAPGAPQAGSLIWKSKLDVFSYEMGLIKRVRSISIIRTAFVADVSFIYYKILSVLI